MKTWTTECEANPFIRRKSRRERGTRHEHGKGSDILWWSGWTVRWLRSAIGRTMKAHALKIRPVSQHVSFQRGLFFIEKAVQSLFDVLPKWVACPVTVCHYYLFSFSYSISSTAYVCTAPTAFLCAVAEGSILFDVPISRFPFITNHPPLNSRWSEGAWR